MTEDFMQPGLESPAGFAMAITPNDGEDLAHATRGIYVGASGDLKVTLAGRTTVTFVDLAAGMIHPLRVVRVFDTDTDATGIVGVY
jgi:hypothetical protein